MNETLKKFFMFFFLTAGIYLCYITSGVYHQKLLKKPYKHTITGEYDYFNAVLFFTIFPQLFAAISGKLILSYQQCIKKEQIVNIPYQKVLICGLIINLNVITYNGAVIQASFPAIVMAKSCSLLSVIVVAVFCSKVKESKLKLSKEKLLIGLLATSGIILFNFYKKQEEKNESDHAISFWSLGSLFLLISLVGDGFLPDFQAQIKSEYKPSSIDMYYHINKLTFSIGLILSIFTKQFLTIYIFLTEYEEFLHDSMIFAVLNGTGQLFIYKMIKQFRQHIPAFVIAFRKCLTVVVNITIFGHLINTEQLIGILLVFLAVFWEVWSNNRPKKQNNSSENSEYKTSSQEKDIDETDRILKSIEDELEQAQLEVRTNSGKIIGV